MKLNPAWSALDARSNICSGLESEYRCLNINPVVGLLEPDPISIRLGTGYSQFENKPLGIAGLCKIGRGIEILAVHSAREGDGNFRQFVSDLKKYYVRIVFWLDMNPVLGKALQRYGFHRVEMLDSDSCKIRGWEWTQCTQPEKKPPCK